MLMAPPTLPAGLSSFITILLFRMATTSTPTLDQVDVAWTALLSSLPKPAASQVLPKEEFFDCLNQLSQLTDTHDLGQEYGINGTQEAVTYGILRVVFTRDYCASAVPVMTEITRTDRDLIRETEALMNMHGAADRVGETAEGREDKRVLQISPKFKPDSDPYNIKTTPQALGTGYTSLTNPAAPGCERFDPSKVCSAQWVGGQLFAWESGVKKATEVGVKIVGLVLASFDVIKLAYDTVISTLSGKSNSQVFTNSKLIIYNQQLQVGTATTALNEITTLQSEATDLYNQTVQLGNNLTIHIYYVDYDLTSMSQKIWDALYHLGTYINDLILAFANTMVAVLSNTEERIINTLTNLILNQMSMGGDSRPNQMPVPNRLNITGFLTNLTSYEDNSFKWYDMPRMLERVNQPQQYLHGYGCDSNDNNNNGEVDECLEDQVAPVLFTDLIAATCRRNTWFTDTITLMSYINQTYYAVDDCGAVTYALPVFTDACMDSTIQLTAMDRCSNSVTATVPVFFDGQPPVVSFQLTPPTDKTLVSTSPPLFKASKAMVDAGLAFLTVQDSCDPNPYVQITVYSDERDAPPTTQALLARRYDPQGRFIGWRVMVRATAAISCENKHVRCSVADGRVYTIRVCGRDAAGLETCQEGQIGIQHKKKPKPPTSQGKAFIVAHDGAHFNMVPNESLPPSPIIPAFL